MKMFVLAIGFLLSVCPLVSLGYTNNPYYELVKTEAAGIIKALSSEDIELILLSYGKFNSDEKPSEHIEELYNRVLEHIGDGFGDIFKHENVELENSGKSVTLELLQHNYTIAMLFVFLGVYNLAHEEAAARSLSIASQVKNSSEVEKDIQKLTHDLESMGL